ncbi:hypothetical protein ACI48D_12100 [Massilia sp. LXY-6]|uniref:hypothetical protein n=1 Tax=Massilia sp. LXY-6 TaxID=3379823 RepID=UPI003EE0B4D9
MRQPSLSQQIRAPQRNVGFGLFRRHRKGAALGAGGDSFLAEAREGSATVGRLIGTGAGVAAVPA